MAIKGKLLQVTSSINLAQGGPTINVRDSSKHVGGLFEDNSILVFGSVDVSISSKMDIFPTLFDNRYGLQFPFRLKKIRTILNSADHILIHGFYLFSTLVCCFLLKNRKIFIMAHGSLEPFQENFGRVRKFFFRTFFRITSRSNSITFLVASRREVSGVKKRFPNFQVLLAGYGVDLPNTEIIPHFVSNSNSVTLGFLGRIHPIKRVDIAIQSVSQFVSLPLNVRLLIGGDGNKRLKSELQQLVKDLFLDEKIEFLGNISTAEKNSFFEKIDVLVLFSENENFSIVVAEAIARKIPVVVRSTVAMSDFVNRYKTGIVVETTYGTEIKEAIEAIYINYSEYADNCARHRSKLLWDNVAQRWVNILVPASFVETEFWS